jgi:hypothetical protein
MIIIKIILVLCIAEIYQVIIMAGVNWLNKTKFELYTSFIPYDGVPPSANKLSRRY